jgi:hypothetical protein
MRTADDYPFGDEVGAALAAIDSTLAGEPVDPSHAELAELTLFLAAERQPPAAAFSAALDRRVAARFAGGERRWRGRRWLFAPAAGLAGAMALGVVFALSTPTTVRNGSVALPTSASAVRAPGTATSAASSSSAQGSPSTSAEHAAASASSPSSPAAPSAVSGAAGAGGSSSSGPSAGSPSSTAASGFSLQLNPSGASAQSAPAPVPPANGRKITQSAQLALNTPANRVDNVAQQVFDVVGSEQGIVKRSTVTATGNPDGYAQFQLSVPSASLSATMTALSRLRYASVASRTDASQDVNGQFNSAKRRLADARALRTSLLKQLAAAVTQSQIDSLDSQIHDAEASISSDQAAAAGLDHQINYSQITLTISALSPPPPVSHGNTFTISRATHDAGRVLTVAAGVALIALAALVPLALLVSVAWWVGLSVRRRRRQQALDLA